MPLLSRIVSLFQLWMSSLMNWARLPCFLKLIFVWATIKFGFILRIFLRRHFEPSMAIMNFGWCLLGSRMLLHLFRKLWMICCVLSFVSSYFYDVLVYSPNHIEHLHHLSIILLVLHDHSFYANYSKWVCGSFGALSRPYYLSCRGATRYKVKAILDWPVPHNHIGLCGFLGLIGFYRWFIHHYVILATPLTDLLQGKVTKINWTTTAKKL